MSGDFVLKQVKCFFTALQFLTRIPCPQFEFKSQYVSGALSYFPLVGLLIGTLLYLTHLLVSKLLMPSLAGIILVICYVIITGGLHLDGLMDTIDGLFSNRSKERMLEIMKDSRVGAHGVTAAVLVLLFKYAVYQQFGSIITWAGIMQVFVLSRWSMVFLIHGFPYLRAEGLGKMYKEGSTASYFGFATLVALLLVVIAQWQLGLLLFGSILVLAWLYGKKVCSLIGGLTGDTYGAFAELVEAVGFLIVLLYYSLALGG